MPTYLDAAVAQLDRTLELHPHHAEATIMRGDILAAKNDYEQAVLKYQKLLEREPNHYGALQRLVDGNRRAGQPPKAIKKTLDRSVASARSPETEYGLQYCIGLHCRCEDVILYRPIDCVSTASACAPSPLPFSCTTLFILILFFTHPFTSLTSLSLFVCPSHHSLALFTRLSITGTLVTRLRRSNTSTERAVMPSTALRLSST